MSKQLGPEDGVLITSYRNGNEAAFNLLVDRYKSKVFTTIFLIVKDQDVAEDLLQDVFVKVLHTFNSDKYNEEGKFQPWVMRIAHNMAIDHLERQKDTLPSFWKMGAICSIHYPLRKIPPRNNASKRKPWYGCAT